jgi:hypothetical protein
MEPAIAVDAEGFPGILLEFGGAVDGFEQREKACRVTMSGRPTVIQGGILPVMPILSPGKRTEGEVTVVRRGRFDTEKRAMIRRETRPWRLSVDVDCQFPRWPGRGQLQDSSRPRDGEERVLQAAKCADNDKGRRRRIRDSND